jgi:hypothetical protein
LQRNPARELPLDIPTRISCFVSQTSNALAQLPPRRRIADHENLWIFLSFRHNIFVSETLFPTSRAARGIMAKLKGKAAIVRKASKSIGAGNAKAIAFWGACWMIGLAVPAPCGGR